MMNMPELDLKDKKILYELDINSRQSFKVLGKKVGLSKEVVNYRVKRLLDEGIIKRFYTRIDSFKIGKIVFRAFLRLHSITPKKQKEIIDHIISNKKVGWVVLVDGAWDINFLFWADDLKSFSEFYKEFLTKYGSNLEDKWVSIYDNYIELPKSFLIKSKRESDDPQYEYGFGKNEEVDETELAIINHLASNSRATSVEISNTIGLTPKVVCQRIKSLEKKGIIKGYGVNIDLYKLGLQYYKLHLNFKTYEKERIHALKEFCKQTPSIMYINDFIGGDDFEIDIYVTGNVEYHTILDKIRYNFSDIIKNFETLQYYKELKYNLFPTGK
jgi:Lrp/AsnC family leucine-responsive transcriptional regulator